MCVLVKIENLEVISDSVFVFVHLLPPESLLCFCEEVIVGRCLSCQPPLAESSSGLDNSAHHHPGQLFSHLKGAFNTRKFRGGQFNPSHQKEKKKNNGSEARFILAQIIIK